MTITKSDITPTTITLLIKADESDLAPIHRHVLSHFRRSVKVPGFRAGKAPLHLVEKHADRTAMLDEFMEHAINELFRRAVDSENIRPVTDPKFQLKSFVPYTDFSFEVSLEVIGKISMPDYKKIKLPKPKVKIDANDVDEVISSLKKQMAEKHEIKRPAKAGDEAIIDFNGTDEKNKPISGASGKDYPLLLGSGTFIPGFEDEVIGLRAGDSKQFKITFPSDYAAKELQGKEVTFSIKLSKLNELAEPKVDDDFAAKVGPFKTVAELKKSIKDQVATERQSQADQNYENELLKLIIEKTKVDIPEGLVESQLDRMEQAEKQNLLYKGQTWQEHLNQEGLTEAQHREKQRPDAIERIKGGLILGEIAEQEKLEVSEAEISKRIAALKGRYQDTKMLAELDKPENRRDLANRILTEKAVAKLVKYASE